MKKRITVSIAGSEYRLIGAEDEEYTRKVAAHVDAKINEVMNAANVSMIEAAVLASVNITDEYYKALETADNLRAQLKDYLEDSGRMKAELSELKRELQKSRGN